VAEDILREVNAHLARKGLLLKKGSIVDATIIPAPSSTKNADGERDPEMHQTKKGNQWHFGMKAHIGVDADSGLVHTVTTTAANEADVEQVADLLHGKEQQVWADSALPGSSEPRGTRRTAVAHCRQAQRHREDARRQGKDATAKAGTPQGERARESGASVPRHQTPVRFREGSLPRLAEEHRSPVDAVRAVESVDGAQAPVGDAGSSPSEGGVRRRKTRQKPLRGAIA
jgi:hypothetical protein